MATDIRNLNWNSTTVDVVAVQVTINALDRTGTANAAGVYDSGVIPKGAIIQSSYLDVTTAFDGTTPTLKVGTSADDDHYFAATSLASIATTAGSLNLNTKEAISDSLYLTLNVGDSTEGEATVYISYIDTAARREIFTV